MWCSYSQHFDAWQLLKLFTPLFKEKESKKEKEKKAEKKEAKKEEKHSKKKVSSDSDSEAGHAERGQVLRCVV